MPLYASCCTVLLNFSRYCTVRLKMLSLFCVCLFFICVESIINLCPWNSPGKNTGVGCHILTPGDLLNRGTEHTSLASPALVGRFFTTSTTWKYYTADCTCWVPMLTLLAYKQTGEAFNRRLPVLDLSGILCSLLIPEYSGIKRRGKPLLGG